MVKKIIIALVIFSVVPMVTLADLTVVAEPSRTGAINFVALLGSAIDVLWIIFVGATVVMLIVTGILFLTTQGDPEKIKKARMALIFCIIGIVVALLGYRMLATINSQLFSGYCCTSPPEGGPPTMCEVSSGNNCPSPGGTYMGNGTCTPNPCLNLE